MTELKKGLSLYGLTMIAIGSCIGSGIFLTPSTIAVHLSTPASILAVWGVGGIIALTGALTFAELSGLFKDSGGIYVYLKEAYGDLWAFWYGWASLIVVNTGAIAALSLACANYLDFVFHFGETGVIVVSISSILLLTVINVVGVSYAELFSNVFTGIKLLGILFIILVGIAYSLPEVEPKTLTEPKETGNAAHAFFLALIGVIWSYGGWQHTTFLSGETLKPRRNIPIAMVIGATVVTVTYMLCNYAYMSLLTVQEIATSQSVAADAISPIFSYGGTLIAIMISISTFGTAGIYTLTAPRIYHAMAKDGLFFSQLAKVHPKYQTPTNAILAQSGWSIVLLLLWGTFEDVITYVTFIDWIFMIMAAVSIFIFRKRMNGAERTYKVPFYPIIPLIFIVISTVFILNTLVGAPIQAGAGIAFMLLGLPFYYWFKKTKKKK